VKRTLLLIVTIALTSFAINLAYWAFTLAVGGGPTIIDRAEASLRYPLDKLIGVVLPALPPFRRLTVSLILERILLAAVIVGSVLAFLRLKRTRSTNTIG
jgi:hypothetical protein